MIFDELPSSWRFVDDEKKLSIYRACDTCKDEDAFLRTTTNILPSFIFRTTHVFYPVAVFTLTEISSGTTFNLVDFLPNFKQFSIGDYNYIAFNTALASDYSIILPTGVYAATVSDHYSTLYSEPIHICDNTDRCIQFNWTNTCDLAGIPYDHLNTAYGVPFVNTFFADINLLSAEYETEKEKLENMLRETDTFFQNQTRTFSVKHKITPEWFVRVAQAMQMHSTIDVIYDVDSNHYGLYTTRAEECTVTSAPNSDESACSSTMTIKFRQDDAIVSAYCCANSEPEPCLTPCYDVIGIIGTFDPSSLSGNYYAIDASDSGVIKQWSVENQTWTIVSTTCTYVYNTVDDTYLFFDGDMWRVTPDITSVSVAIVQGDFTTINIVGYTMPGTFVYICVDSGSGCQYEEPNLAISASQLANPGWDIVVPNIWTGILCIKSQNLNCIYDERTIDTSGL